MSLAAHSVPSDAGSRIVDRATEIALSYEPTAFAPSRFLANRHIQTVAGALLRGDDDKAERSDIERAPASMMQEAGTSSYTGGLNSLDAASTEDESGRETSGPSSVYMDPNSPFWDARERFETPDGDFFDVDYRSCASVAPSRGLVVMTHGLESNSGSALNRDAAGAFLSRGLDVACINFRGCSGEPNRTWRFYILGFTDDLLHFIEGHILCFGL